MLHQRQGTNECALTSIAIFCGIPVAQVHKTLEDEITGGRKWSQLSPRHLFPALGRLLQIYIPSVPVYRRWILLGGEGSVPIGAEADLKAAETGRGFIML